MRRFIEYIKSCKINGGFIASPIYKPYRRVWLRDHSFTTFALMQAGENILQEIYWIKKILTKEAEKVKNLIEKPDDALKLLDQDKHPRARYTPYFDEINEPWSERQYDGIALAYGTLIYYENLTRNHLLDEDTKKLYDSYFERFYNTPCADLWEMHEDFIHAETLGAIYWAIAQRAKQISNNSRYKERVMSLKEKVRALLLSFEKNGVIYKMKKTPTEEATGIDASVILIFTFFEVLKDLDLLQSTLQEIYYYLSPDGLGLRRFKIGDEVDTYFGGGIWYILNYWAAEAFHLLGETEKVKKLLEYRFRFPIPEQIIEDKILFSKEHKNYWILKSKKENNGIPGPADPLTWSNSEFLRVFLKVKI
ncbi:MAG: glycoside hydrolase family 15 protein [candidate division WOR-3 bacterium]